MDFDGQARPNPGGGIDSGADEFYLMANYVNLRQREDTCRSADSRRHHNPKRSCQCNDYNGYIRELQLCRSGKRCIYGDAGFCRVCIHTDEQGGNDKRGEYNRPELHRHTSLQ